MDIIAIVLGFIIVGILVGLLIAAIRSRAPSGGDIAIVKKAVHVLEGNKWSLLIRPVGEHNIYGIITDRWRKEHNISGRMRDRGHVVSIVDDEEWEEWLDYYNPTSGRIDTLIAADGTAVMTMALLRNLNDSIRDIRWFIPHGQAREMKTRADYATALEGRLHDAERDLEDVDNLRRAFHRDRKKLQVQTRALNTENDMLNKQINELFIINSNLEREVTELRNWKEFGQRYLLSEKKGIKDTAEFLTTSLQDVTSDHLMHAAEQYDKVSAKMPPPQTGGQPGQQSPQLVEMQPGGEGEEKVQQLEKKEGA